MVGQVELMAGLTRLHTGQNTGPCDPPTGTMTEASSQYNQAIGVLISAWKMPLFALEATHRPASGIGQQASLPSTTHFGR